MLASYGHVRELPPKSGSVDPDKDFSMQWAVKPSASSRMREIGQSLQAAQALILATDPDREGEAIAWHVQQELEVALPMSKQYLLHPTKRRCRKAPNFGKISFCGCCDKMLSGQCSERVS